MISFTDTDILEVMVYHVGRHSLRPVYATYVVRNVIAGKLGRPEIRTSQVLRRLKRLEKEGKVARVPTTYAVMISWRLTDAGLAAVTP